MAVSSGTKQRRTQEERRAETRGKLLDATIRSLLDVGYAATTTRRVAELAGVSQGAQTHHFPYRVDLVGAAIEQLAERRIVELRRKAASLPEDDEERVRAVVDLLWGDFSSDLFTIFVKLWVAAADDRELYDRLVPLERTLTREIAKAMPGIVGGRDVPDDLAARVTTTLAAMRGLALSRAFEPAGRRARDPWATVRPVLVRLLLG
jgi:AcrR family transcriptional regulator